MTAYHPIKIPGRSRRRGTIFGLVLFLVLISSLSRPGFRHWAGAISLKILSPFWTVGRGVGNVFDNIGFLFANKLNLANENARLRAILDQQLTALLNQEILKQENATLRQIVNRLPDSLPLAVGRLISQGQQFPLGTAIIDVGSQNVNTALVPGLVAVSEGTVVLGQLVEVYDTKAKISFYSTTGARLPGNLGEKNIPIELIGRGGGNFTALLPRDLAVAMNDQVTITIAGHNFLLAVVNDIRRAAGDSFQKIFLRQPVNISQLTWIELYAP